MASAWAFDVALQGNNVLYGVSEDLEQYGGRYEALMAHHGKDPEGFFYTREETLLDGKDAYAHLSQDLAKRPVDLLVIDTLSAAAGPYNEIDPHDVLELKDRALSLHKIGARAVLVVAHHGWETGRVIGSSAFVRQFRTTWDLLREGEDPTVRVRDKEGEIIWLKCSKDRLNKEPPPAPWRFTKVPGMDDPVVVPVPTTEVGKTEVWIRNAMKGKEPLTVQQIAEVTSIPASTVSRWLNKMSDAESSGEGRAKVWELS